MATLPHEHDPDVPHSGDLSSSELEDASSYRRSGDSPASGIETLATSIERLTIQSAGRAESHNVSYGD